MKLHWTEFVLYLIVNLTNNKFIFSHNKAQNTQNITTNPCKQQVALLKCVIGLNRTVLKIKKSHKSENQQCTHYMKLKPHYKYLLHFIRLYKNIEFGVGFLFFNFLKNVDFNMACFFCLTCNDYKNNMPFTFEFTWTIFDFASIKV